MPVLPPSLPVTVCGPATVAVQLAPVQDPSEEIEKLVEAVTSPSELFEASNPWALRSIAERLLEAVDRGLWDASPGALATLRSAVLEGEGWEEER